MATITNGIQTSFSNTPQAKDDIYGWTEDELLSSGLLHGSIITLNVMSTDLGGNAKALFSIDDGNGHTNITDYDLLTVDGLINGISAWELTAAGNRVRIDNGKIDFDIANYLTAHGVASVEALAAGDYIPDEFVYAIRPANGTLSQAKVNL